jgi:CAAD domains of cyanobacterial aminoacyl-tRNA synthetase
MCLLHESAGISYSLSACVQVIGIAFSIQFVARRLLFAEKRQETLAQLDSLINEKIAAGTLLARSLLCTSLFVPSTIWSTTVFV